MNSDPKCLVAVPTYGRPQFLPRILACFKRLKYTNKKLLIINDDPSCRYIYDDPEVDIVNIDKHLQLSVKRNLFASWDFDIMFPLDDDDLFLPDRLTNHVEQYIQYPNIDLYRNKVNVLLTNKVITTGQGGAFTNSSFSRDGYFKSMGYTGFTQANQDDISLRSNFKKRCNVKIEQNWSKCDFVYQIMDGRYHVTYIKDVIVDDSVIEKSKITGDIVLSVDYKTYDDIVEMSMDVLENDTPINIEMSDDKSKVTRA
jgi:hypothetical protein